MNHCKRLARRLLYVWGNAEHGRLGLQPVPSGVFSPRWCPGLEDIERVSCGAAHTLVLTRSGEVWSFGLNSHGQLGHSPNADQVTSPRRVDIPEPVESISAGEGNVWSFGCNRDGQLGLPDRSHRVCFGVILHEWDLGEEIVCGASHSLALTNTNEVFSWGVNQYGQLGHDKSFFGSNVESTPRLIRGLREVEVVSLSAGHVCSGAVDKNGLVYTWGGNHFWQLGLPSIHDQSSAPQQIPELFQVKKLVLGGCHAMCFTTNESVYVWGSNENGCLGLGQSTLARWIDSSYASTTPDPQSSRASQEGWRDWSVGRPSSVQMTVQAPLLLPDFRLRAGSLGWKHSVGISPTGEVYGWGWGGSVGESSLLFESDQGPGGQLGLGDDYDAWFPVEIKLPEEVERFHQIDCGLNHTVGIGEVYMEGAGDKVK